MAHMTPKEFLKEKGYPDTTPAYVKILLSEYHDYTLKQAAEDVKPITHKETNTEGGYFRQFSVYEGIDKQSILRHLFNKD